MAAAVVTPFTLTRRLACERVPSGDPATDWLRIRVALKKGERGTLELVDAQAIAGHGEPRSVSRKYYAALTAAYTLPF